MFILSLAVETKDIRRSLSSLSFLWLPFLYLTFTAILYIFRILILRYIQKRLNRVFRQAASHLSNLIHQIITDTLTLSMRLVLRIIPDRITDYDLLKRRSIVHRNEVNTFTCLTIVHPVNIHKPRLKLIDDVIVLRRRLRENDNVLPSLQSLHGILQSVSQTLVPVNSYCIRLREDTD